MCCKLVVVFIYRYHSVSLLPIVFKVSHNLIEFFFSPKNTKLIEFIFFSQCTTQGGWIILFTTRFHYTNGNDHYLFLLSKLCLPLMIELFAKSIALVSWPLESFVAVLLEFHILCYLSYTKFQVCFYTLT